jgi:pyridoxal/pyridoxine/pyridoxamine kinase
LIFKERFHGAGDLSTALYAHYINEKVSLKQNLENVTGDIYNMLAKKKLKSSRRISFKAKSLNNL